MFHFLHTIIMLMRQLNNALVTFLRQWNYLM